MEKHNHRTFIRSWYRWERSRLTGERRLVPGAGPKTPVNSGLTYSEAKRACAAYNATHNPGLLSRKMEFESY